MPTRHKFLSDKIDFERLLYLILIGVGCFAISAYSYMKFQGPKQFVPPTERERRAALGDIEGLPDNAKRGFRATQMYVPMGQPEALDWLAHFPEEGQTFQKYMNSGFPKPDEKRKIIYFQPLRGEEKTEIEDLSKVEEFCEKFFGLKIARLPDIKLETGTIASRGRGESKQWNAEDILDELKKKIPEDAFCVLGISMVDLYHEGGFNYVFGLASLRERVGVYSFVRLKSKNKNLFLKRSCKLMAHETGHIFGCYHCVFYKCLLNGANSLWEEDSTPIHLCPVCLRKLNFNIGFDIVKRYGGLEAFFEKNGFQEEKQWTAAMIDIIEGNKNK